MSGLIGSSNLAHRSNKQVIALAVKKLPNGNYSARYRRDVRRRAELIHVYSGRDNDDVRKPLGNICVGFNSDSVRSADCSAPQQPGSDTSRIGY
jgi:hypothetical protein